MRKIKTLFIAAVLIAFGASAFAADATVTFVSGKVEVQRNGKWVALQKGDTVAQNETISTGFQSEAKIKLMDSVMYLGPVTRITLEELSTVDQTDNVNVYRKTGSARSQVRHVDNKRVNYQVHTAVAVASCRGTGWIVFDSNRFIGTEGEFAIGRYTGPGFYNMAGTLVRMNQVAGVSGNNKISAPVGFVEQAIAEVNATATTAGDNEAVGGAGFGSDSGSGNGLAGGSSSGSSSGNENKTETPKTASVTVSVEIPE